MLAAHLQRVMDMLVSQDRIVQSALSGQHSTVSIVQLASRDQHCMLSFAQSAMHTHAQQGTVHCLGSRPDSLGIGTGGLLRT